jgi:hypothetical protein
VHGIQNIPHHLDLRGQLVGHLVVGGLVLGESLMSEGGARQIEGHRHHLRLLLVEDLEEHAGEPIGGVRHLPGGVRQRRESEERAVDEAVAVDEDKTGARC